jgi:hypothetical protein
MDKRQRHTPEQNIAKLRPWSATVLRQRVRGPLPAYGNRAWSGNATEWPKPASVNTAVTIRHLRLK